MFETLLNNYEWIFSGVGSGLAFWILGYKKGYRKGVEQSMKVSSGSVGIQVGGSVNAKEK